MLESRSCHHGPGKSGEAPSAATCWLELRRARPRCAFTPPSQLPLQTRTHCTTLTYQVYMFPSRSLVGRLQLQKLRSRGILSSTSRTQLGTSRALSISSVSRTRTTVLLSSKSTSAYTDISTRHQRPRPFSTSSSSMSAPGLSVELTAPNGRKYTQPQGLFINNEFVPAKSGEKIVSINPTYVRCFCFRRCY